MKVKSRVTTVKAKSKTHESRDKDKAMKTETNTTRSTYEIKENTHKTKNKWTTRTPPKTMFFVSAGVPNGEFPEILITKCRSRFYCTWFFSRAEYFESWREGRKGHSKSGEKCSRLKVHMYEHIQFDSYMCIRNV